MEYAIPPGDSRLSGNPFEEPVQESIQRGFFEPSVDGNGERGYHDGQRRGPTTRTTAPLTRPDQHEDTPEHVREDVQNAADPARDPELMRLVDNRPERDEPDDTRPGSTTQSRPSLCRTGSVAARSHEGAQEQEREDGVGDNVEKIAGRPR